MKDPQLVTLILFCLGILTFVYILGCAMLKSMPKIQDTLYVKLDRKDNMAERALMALRDKFKVRNPSIGPFFRECNTLIVDLETNTFTLSVSEFQDRMTVDEMIKDLKKRKRL